MFKKKIIIIILQFGCLLDYIIVWLKILFKSTKVRYLLLFLNKVKKIKIMLIKNIFKIFIIIILRKVYFHKNIKVGRKKN